VRVQPDELIADGDNFLDLPQDAKVQAALRWLKTPKAARIPQKGQ
jgi:hypothetical protein